VINQFSKNSKMNEKLQKIFKNFQKKFQNIISDYQKLWQQSVMIWI